MSIFIEDVKISEGGKKLKPLRVEFVHGAPNMNQVDGIKTGLFSDSLNEKEMITVCESAGMFYMGNTVNSRQENQNVFIAVRNKKTNKVKLVEVSKVSLAPVVKFPSSTNPMFLGSEPTSKKDLNKAFVHKFGMLKGQRIYDQAERLTVNADTVKESLDSAALTNASIEESDLVPVVESFEKYLPPRKTSGVVDGNEVYQMEDILSGDDFITIGKLFNAIFKDEKKRLNWIKETKLSDYVTAEFLRVNSSANNYDEPKKLKLSKALVYTDCLINLASTVKREGAFFHNKLGEYIAKKFIASGSKRNSTGGEKDTMACHAIVLALIIGDCCFDADMLCKDLGMRAERFSKLLQGVGARYIGMKEEESGGLATLTIPLAPPIKTPMKVRSKRK